MSKQVDERVVEMRFDNKNFENNVKTTMSTLEKLKQKLSFKGASKGLEQLNTSVKKVDMSGLGKSVDQVGLKFNGLYTMADQALRNITTRVQQTGERMIKALTLDPITTGFQEYETQINAVQTILANTSSKGTDINDVNKALDELNLYADKTIYNFTEMTRNIGTFTAAGIDLDTSVSAIQGIANLAAVSGSTSQQASTAMYQLSQALATGTVKLMDWNSVVNAGMGGQVFQDALKRTATNMGTNVDAMIEKYGSFRDSLTQGEWVTSEVLTKTLEQFTMAAEEGSEMWDKYKKSLMEEGYTDEQATEILKMANTATDAATKVKTFTQLWDVMKESVQSGWAQTWEILVGDFEEAKALLTPLSDFFTETIGNMSNARNELLNSALGRGFTDMFDGMKEVLTTTQKGIDNVLAPVKATSKALEDLGVTVDKVIGGSFGNGKERYDALTAAGINYYEAQNKVNETLGNSFRYTEEQIAAQDKLLGKQKEVTDETKEQGEETAELTDNQKVQLKNLAAMTEEQLKSKGYTDEQIESLRQLGVQADKLGLSVNEFIDNIDQINGRWLLINSFKNVGQSLVKIFQSMGQAWRDVFPPMQAEQLFNIIGSLHRFSTYLKMSDDTAENLRRTLRGVFSVIDIIATITGGAFRIAFKVLTQLLGYFDMDLLDLTAKIGDAIYQFDQWLNSIIDFTAIFDVLIPGIKNVVRFIADLVDSFLHLPKVQKILNKFREAFEKLKEYDYASVGQDIIKGFSNGLKDGVKNAIKTIVDFGQTLIDDFKEILGVQSPSWKAYEIASDFIRGFINGLAGGLGWIIDGVKNVGKIIIDAFKSINWDEALHIEGLQSGLKKFKDLLGNFDYSKLLALIPIGIVLLFVKKIYDVGKLLADGIDNFNEVIGNFALIEKNFAKVLGGFAANMKADAFKKIAIAIAILAGSLIALTFVDPNKLVEATIVVVILAGVLAALAFALDKISNASIRIGKGGVSVQGLMTGLLSIAAVLLVMAGVVKLVGSMSPEEAKQGFEGLVTMLGSLLLFITGLKLVGTIGGNDNFSGVGGMLIKLSVAMLLLVGVCKLIAKLTPEEMYKGAIFAGAFGIFVMALAAVSSIAGEHVSKVGGMALKITIAMGLMVGVCKLIAMLKPDEIKMGLAFMAIFTLFVGALVAVTTIGKDDKIAKVGGLLLSISVSLLLMVAVCKLVGKLEPGEIAKGLIFTTVFMGLVILMTKLLTITNEQQIAKVAGTILAFSVAIGILAALSILMSLMTWEGLAKGVGAITVLGLVMAAMVRGLKGANNVVGSLVVMTIAIAVMAGAVAALSTINWDKLLPAVAGLALIMGMFALIERQAIYTRKASGTILIMTLAIGMLGGMMYLLAKLPAQQTLAASAALSMLMIALSGTLIMLSNLMGPSKKALQGVVYLTAMAIPLLAFVGILALMQGIENATSNAMLLVKLATVLTLLLFPLSLIGALIGASGGMTLMGVVALTAMAIPLLAFVGILALMQGIENATANISLLTSLMTVMTEMLFKLSIVAPLAILGLSAIQGLILLMLEVGMLATTMGYLMDKFPSLQEFLDTGLPLLERLATSIGTMFGNLVNGFATAIASGLPEIGTQLSMFMVNVTPFIAGAKMIDESVLVGIASLSGAILLLTAADLVTGIASLIPFSSSLPQLGTELSMFMMNAMPFFAGSMMIDPAVMEGIKALAQAILILTAANIVDGIVNFVTGGGSSLSEFGGQLAGLGTNLNTFATNLGTFDEAKVTTIKCAAEAIKVMAEASKVLPNEGGWAAKIFGENSLATFGSYLGPLGTNLSTFATNLGTFDESKVETVKCAAEAIKVMAEAASNLPNEGGWAAKIFGENSISTFGNKLPALGTNLNSFATNLGTFGEDKVATVTCAANAIKIMAEAANNIPNEGGWAAKIFGENSLATFGANLASLGTDLGAFATNLGTFDDGKVSTVNSAVKAIKALSGLANADLEGAKKHLGGFGDKLINFASDLADFCTTMPAGSTITTATTSIKKLINTIRTVTQSDGELAKNFAESLKKLGEDGVKAFVKAISSSTAKQNVKTAAKELVDKMIEGIESKQDDVGTAFADLAESGTDDIEAEHSSFYDAGAYLVEGFVAGINDNIASAAAAAAAMASAAAASAKANLEINSPSKVFRAIGNSVPEGFAQGIDRMVGLVTGSTNSMASTAIYGVKSSIARISDAIDSDIDTQPTIRPVLDLSDVRNGAGSIGGMFGNVGMSANIDTISSMMSGYSQNGGNAAVVSAIDKLRKDLGNIGGTTYSINGITYDDGSNVANAIGEIARAALRERRM